MNLAIQSYRSQVYYLRKIALEALPLYDVKHQKIELVMHGENTTFKITTTNNKKYALRIHRLNYHSYDGIMAELIWLNKLKNNSYFRVPVPILGKNKQYIQTVKIDKVQNPRHVVLSPWLNGRLCRKSLTTTKMEEVGICTAKLQLSAKQIPMSIAQNRLRWDFQGFFGPNAVASTKYFESTTKQQAKIIAKCISKIRESLGDLHNNPDCFGLIHADLHTGNFLFDKDKVAIIDFDDSGLGYYMYDLAVTIAAMKNLPQREKLKNALLEGYHKVTPVTLQHYKLIELFYVVRHLTVLGWICDRTDLPYFKNIIPDRIKTTTEICKQYNQNKDIIYKREGNEK